MDKTLKEKLNTLALRDNEIMRVIKTHEISHILANSPRGTLVLSLPFKGTGSDYKFVLDAVPVSEEENTSLMNVMGLWLIDKLLK